MAGPKQRFKKTFFQGMCVYQPTVYTKGSVLISDKFHKKDRLRYFGGLDRTFSIRANKNSCLKK